MYHATLLLTSFLASSTIAAPAVSASNLQTTTSSKPPLCKLQTAINGSRDYFTIIIFDPKPADGLWHGEKGSNIQKLMDTCGDPGEVQFRWGQGSVNGTTTGHWLISGSVPVAPHSSATGRKSSVTGDNGKTCVEDAVNKARWGKLEAVPKEERMVCQM